MRSRRLFPVLAVLVLVGGGVWIASGVSVAGGGEECQGEPATITLSDGADDVDGSDSRDVIVALGGSDEIHGLAGNDLICLGNGNDEAQGDDGSDDIYGGAGADDMKDSSLLGEVDYYEGGKGDDEINGSGGADQIFGGEDEDLLTGGDGRDCMVGNQQDDELKGEGRGDKLDGDGGHDVGRGGDTLVDDPIDSCWDIEEEHACEVGGLNGGFNC